MDGIVGPYAELFLANTPEQFLRDVVIGIIDAYSQSYARAKAEFHPKIAKTYRPFLRRSIIEQRLLNAAAPFPTLAATIQEDDSSGFWTHAHVLCNGRVALTQSTAKDPNYVIRHSDFRAQCAIGNGQLLLFPDPDVEAAAAAAALNTLYVILLHGRCTFAGRLAFATLRFPRPDLSGYYGDHVSLLQRYPDLAALAAAVQDDPDADAAQEEDVGDLPQIDLNEQDEIG
jgi:hypothetical protein